jgi:hypothetical protein
MKRPPTRAAGAPTPIESIYLALAFTARECLTVEEMQLCWPELVDTLQRFTFKCRHGYAKAIKRRAWRVLEGGRPGGARW